MTRKHGGVFFWYDIVQYLLRDYPQANHITDAILKVRTTRQHKKEVEKELSCCLNHGVERCGNIHEPTAVITPFVEELNPEIRCLAQTYWDSNRGAFYLQ